MNDIAHSETTDKRAARPLATFLCLQVALLAAGSGWAAYRTEQLRNERALPAARDEPLQIGPLYDWPDVINDDQLAATLGKLVPRFADPSRVKVSTLEHALRFWSAAAEFSDPECLSGEQICAILLDHARFAATYGPNAQPLLIDTTPGVRLRVQEGLATSSHQDHSLAALAEIGTHLDRPVAAPNRQTTVRALLEQSLRDFSLNQVEYEWSALSYVLYLPAIDRWVTSEGQRVTFDQLAERIMRQRLPQGVCYGHHRMHALVMLLRVDDQARILSDPSRTRIVEYVKDVTARLVERQHSDGYWTREWSGEPIDEPAERTTQAMLQEQILATGHPLEWWALAPAELHPPREVVARAGQWIVRTIEQLTPEQVEELYSPLSHAGRALALWRGRMPAEIVSTRP